MTLKRTGKKPKRLIKYATIYRKIAKLVRKLVVAFSAVLLGHYRNLELDKIQALKIAEENFDSKMSVWQETKEEKEEELRKN